MARSSQVALGSKNAYYDCFLHANLEVYSNFLIFVQDMGISMVWFELYYVQHSCYVDI